MKRTQAAIGYAVYLVGRRVVRRKARGAVEGLRPHRRRGGRGGAVDVEKGTEMLKKTTTATRAGADRASSLADALRPVVTRALSDPELHSALRQAFETGRQVTDELGGKKPSKAARKLAKDRKLRQRVQESALDLRDAWEHVAEPPGKRRGRRLLTLLALAAAAAGAFVFARKRSGGDDF